MSNVAIRVEHLGKEYRLGERQLTYLTFREALVDNIKTPLRWLKGERRAEQNSFWALDDISFEVQHGDAVGIIGRNGAGKSTLLKILSQITSPTRGRVDIFGRVGSLLEVGTGFHPELSGRENIYLNGAILGMSRIEIASKFDEIVDFSGVEKFLDTPVKHYSSGMYVRLAFAVAAHLEPEILVVDEVLAVGDAEFQKKCLGKMDTVAKDGRTVLYVSHNMDSIERLCSRAIWLSNGKIQELGETEKVVSQYLNSGLPNENLTNWLNRKGSQKIIFKELTIYRKESQLPTREIRTGDAVRFLVELRSDDNYSRAYVGLQITDFKGDLVFAFHSQESGFRCDIRKGLNQFKLNVPFMPLLPGNYFINLAVLLPDKSLADEILMSDTLVVYPADLYTSGYPFLSAHGKIFIDHQWVNLLENSEE